MTDLKTPYLDSEINGMKFMVRDNSLSVIGTERLEEYQSIKEALKRLGELEWKNCEKELPSQSGIYWVWEFDGWNEAHWNGWTWKATQRTQSTPTGGKHRETLNPTHWKDIVKPLKPY